MLTVTHQSNGKRLVCLRLRGTLPLDVFGPDRYAVAMGRLARPMLVAQALTPLAGGLLAEHNGPLMVLAVLGILAVGNVGVALVLRYYLPSRQAIVDGASASTA